MIAEQWIMDLYDTIPPVSLKEDAEFEQKHPRDAGKFSKTRGEGKKVEGKGAALKITPVTPSIKGFPKFGKNDEVIEGSIGKFDITTQERGLISKVPNTTWKMLKKALADPAVLKSMDDAGIHTLHLRPAKGGAAPRKWTAAVRSGVLIFHPRTAAEVNTSKVEERKKGGIQRVIHHEAGHELFDQSSDEQKKAMTEAVKNNPKVQEEIGKVVALFSSANLERFDPKTKKDAATGEVHAELTAMMHYDAARFAKMPEDIRSAVEAISKKKIREIDTSISTLYEDAEFEQKHPRDGGQFTTKGGASKKKSQITVERFRNNERIKDFTANKGDLVSLFLSKDRSTVVKIVGISKDSKKVRVRFFNPRTNEVAKGKGIIVSPGELDNLTTDQKQNVQAGKDVKKKKAPKKERLSKLLKKASKEPEGGFSAADLVPPRESEDWVSALYERKEFDESKIKRDMGKFSRTQGAGKREREEKVDRPEGREKGNGRSGGQKTSDRAFRVSSAIKKLEGDEKLQAHEQAAQLHDKASRRLAKEGNMELASWHKGIGLAHQNAIKISENKAFAKTTLGVVVDKAIEASNTVQDLFTAAVENFPRNRESLVKGINNAILVNTQVRKEAIGRKNCKAA